MENRIANIFWCDKREKCQWKCFALNYHGMSLGTIDNVLSAWRESHEYYCGGELIQGEIITRDIATRCRI